MPPKRRRESSGGSGGGGAGVVVVVNGGADGGGGLRSTHPPPALTRRCRSFDLEIRGCRHLQELTTRMDTMEAAISRIPEELRKVLMSFINVPGATIQQNRRPIYKLCFVNSMSDEIFTKRNIRAADGGHIKIKMIVSNQEDRNCPRLLSSNVKIVVLDGDFNADNHEGWTSEKFNEHIVRPRDKVGAVLTGKLDVKLEDGEAYLRDVTFIDNSSFTRSRQFRLGVKLIDDLGEQVQEGITEPFTVKDRRGEGYKKRDIPRLDDEVWRLKGIAKGGVFHQALENSGVTLVKHLLRLYYNDPKSLHKILGNTSQSVWKTIVNHAEKCNPGRSLYSYFIEDKKIRLYFSSLGQIAGATIAGQYNAFGDFDTLLKSQVEEWSKDAYTCMTYHQPDYEMYNNQPRPLSCSTLQGYIDAGPKSTEPNDHIHEAYEQDTSEDIGFSGTRSQQCTIERLGSIRVTTLPPVQENNETDVSFDIDVQLNSGAEVQVQYGTPDANYTAGSVTLHCPTTASNEIIESVALDQTALTLHQEDYPTSFTSNGPSLGDWYPEEVMVPQYASPFPPNMQVDIPVLSTQSSFNIYEFLKDPVLDKPQFCTPTVSTLPHVGSGMTKLPSSHRWAKLSALVKWKAMVRAAKRARLMFGQEY